MMSQEFAKVEKYLQAKFKNTEINLQPNKADEDMMEVFIGSEFVGTLYRDNDEGEISYDFNMSIIDIDIA